MYQGVLKDEERVRLKALTKPQPPTYSTPLNTPSSPVQQPAAVVDDDCITCVISPPPELVESQSKEQRAVERRERMAEYEAQKGLAEKLGNEQGVSEKRMV
jgi:protein PET117